MIKRYVLFICICSNIVIYTSNVLASVHDPDSCVTNLNKIINIFMSGDDFHLSQFRERNDSLNGFYFKMLLDKKRRREIMGVAQSSFSDRNLNKYTIDVTNYHYGEFVNNSKYAASSQNAVLWIKFIDLEINSSLLEKRVLQLLDDANSFKFGDIFIQDFVSSKTRNAINDIWQKNAVGSHAGNHFDHPTYSYSYSDLIMMNSRMRYTGSTYQAQIPTLLKGSGKISIDEVALGGNGIFAMDALMLAYKKDALPKTENNKVLISSIGNGNGLSSIPDEYMVGLMIDEKIPIAMITTDGAPNVPMILINYDILVPKIKSLVSEIGENKFLKLVTPDLIESLKEKKDASGNLIDYIQLEGNMESVFLNLDQFWQKRYGESIVFFVNIGLSKTNINN